MSEHHITTTREAVLESRDPAWLMAVAGECAVEPADPANCPNCLAYQRAQLYETLLPAAAPAGSTGEASPFHQCGQPIGGFDRCNYEHGHEGHCGRRQYPTQPAADHGGKPFIVSTGPGRPPWRRLPTGEWQQMITGTWERRDAGMLAEVVYRLVAERDERISDLLSDGDEDVRAATHRIADAIGRPVSKAHYQSPRGADTFGSLLLEVADRVERAIAERDDALAAARAEVEKGARDYCDLMERRDAEFVRAEKAESSLAAERQARARERGRWLRVSEALRRCWCVMEACPECTNRDETDEAMRALSDALLAEGGGEGGA